ncbi:MAG: hypothetical protein ACJ762_07805 [Solirubrobacteraceae bacterium]
MTRLALLFALAVLALPALAQADPRPSPSQSTTCDHSMVALHTSHRHVNYLHQTYTGCATAHHVAQLWLVHDCGTALCNFKYQDIWWSCSGRKTSYAGDRDEWLATCRQGGYVVLIGWVRK